MFLKLRLPAFLSIFIWQMGSAQPVVFTLQTQLLHPTSGFANYVDCAVDMNGDHLDDVVRIGNKGFYVDFQQPGGTFDQRFFPLLVQSPPHWSVCAGDLDNDGFNDLLFAGGTAVSFVKASNGGDFYEETVMPVSIFSQRSTFADVNDDGWLDAFVCHDEGQSVPFKNDGAGNLSPDFNLIQTANLPGNYAAIWTDYDNDADIDLYVTKCWAFAAPGDPTRTNLLYKNNGDGTFAEVGAQANVNDNAQSWATVFEDFDGDGDFDAFVVNHDFNNRLFRNNYVPGGGAVTFANVISASGIAANDLGAWENAAGDFNNDGNVDIFSDLQKELYLGNGDLTFTGQEAPVRPGAIADLNGDGFLDVLNNSQLWLNEPNGNHWLKVVPLGLAGNRNGIGARVEIFGAWGMQVREVRSGQSFRPMSSLTAHFGLGQNQQVDSLKIKWTSGIVTTLAYLPADTLIVVPEANCPLPTAQLSFVGEPKICPGDSTELQAPAGFASYAWSNGQAGQSLQVKKPGRYFAILTDPAGCVALSQVLGIQGVEEVSPAIFTPSGNVACLGDTLVLTASPGENYAWSTGETGVNSIAVWQSGSYSVAVDAQCFQGKIASPPFAVTFPEVPPPTVELVEIDQNDSILLTAQGENCRWYDQPTGGNLLAETCDFQTPPLAAPTTFFVESRQFFPGETQSGGKPDTSGAGGDPAQSGFLKFETWSPFTLQSVTVFTSQFVPGQRHVQLWSNDTMLTVKAFQLTTGFNVLDLNFEIPPGKYELRCPQGNLWRNVGELNYPYPIGDVGRIVTTSFGDGYYYYFYDWQIKKTPDFECVSVRTPVPVIVNDAPEPNNGAAFRIFPNPATGAVFVETNRPATQIRLFDTAGREALRRDLSGELRFEIEMGALPPGVFWMQVLGQDFVAAGKILL